MDQDRGQGCDTTLCGAAYTGWSAQKVDNCVYLAVGEVQMHLDDTESWVQNSFAIHTQLEEAMQLVHNCESGGWMGKWSVLK